MVTKLSTSVAELTDEQRRVVESLTGLSLLPEQVVYWVVATPGLPPSSVAKAAARAGLQELFDKVDHHMSHEGVDPGEYFEAVDEAIADIRKQSAE